MDRITRTWLACLVAAALCAGVRVSAEEEQVPPGYLEEQRARYEAEVAVTLEWYSKAYQLTEQQRAEYEAALRARIDAAMELDRQIRAAAMEAAKAWEEAVAKHGEDWVPTEEERKALSLNYDQLVEKMPLSSEAIQRFVESKLPPETAELGRERLKQLEAEAAAHAEELARQYEAEQHAQQIATAVVRAQVREEMNAHRRADAEVSPEGKPMPKPEYTPPEAPVIVVPQGGKPQVSPPAAPPKPKSAPLLPPPERETKPVDVPKPQPAPPPDEWAKLVDSMAQKYKFEPPQATKAQAILKELRQRAEQYRQSHVEDYERLARISDANERKAEERRLNEPLDELFAELKERIEQLPTASQREAAGASKSSR
ncbi:MAG: hypothetical protein L6Q92_04030 [Phycisphaerae bacterium]|nr:hypothetical protein [Phycisphaerae bacterium]